MSDLVALIIGIAHYPELQGWDVAGDRTANDAIAVTRELVDRGVDPKKIKLMLSMKEGLPADIAGVRPALAHSGELKQFIQRELGKKPFVGDRFFLFCSGHGVSADTHQETLIILADSFTVPPNKRLFNCLGIERLRLQLQGATEFPHQLFCINACRTPASWTLAGDDQIEPVATVRRARHDNIAQARFFAVDELKPSPVEDNPRGFSNGFAEAIVNCIKSGEWPPRDSEWILRLDQDWPETKSFGIHGPDRIVFKRMYGAIHGIDRQRQSKLASLVLDRAQKWGQRRREGDGGDLSRSTLIDLHACTSDRLDVLMTQLERTVFSDRIVPGGVQRADRWPRRGLDARRREKQLIEELTYCLAEDRDLTDADEIVKAVAAVAPGVRVAYVEIDGPCQPEDEELVKAMRAFWGRIIAAAVKGGARVPCLPLLLVGHVDPEPTPNAPPPIDTTRFYHNDILAESHERRLNLVRGDHLRMWLDGIMAPGNLGRIDLERELARDLGGRLLEDVTVRMGRIIEVVNARSP